MLLLESSVEIAHKIYVDNMKRLGKDNEKLRGWLSEANTQSRESNRIIIKQYAEIKQVKNGLRDKLEKSRNQTILGRSRKKKEKSAITEIPILVDDQELVDEERFTAYESRSNLNKSAYIVEGIHLLYKVLKTISKNWKLLMYLKNKNIMKTVIKNGLERGMVWSFRRFKEPIRSKQEEKNTINQFRKRLEVNEEKTVTGSQLKKDNATTDEVVNIINEQREEKDYLFHNSDTLLHHF
uniref:Uncharacterized protein n=1 Tax=Rhizophagus irregularis (strain DAOM 181602 / DAOM 197198 / MUCL 43194) TaxID=747089 RepID=U9UKT5_RHIID